MSDLISVQGIVLSTMPIGDYDKRVVLLTKERGKITAFAKGARRTNSPLLAAANPFAFGSFYLYEGKSSYHLNQAEITSYFTELASRQPGVYYGFYFLELADYYGREYTDERQMINLLYISLKALLNPHIEDELVHCIFELKTMVVQGEYPEMFQCVHCQSTEDLKWFDGQSNGMVCADCKSQAARPQRVSPSALYAMQYIISTPMQKLYSFTVTPEVLRELGAVIHGYVERSTDKRFKSLEILRVML